jgi:hypothetical protein
VGWRLAGRWHRSQRVRLKVLTGLRPLLYGCPKRPSVRVAGLSVRRFGRSDVSDGDIEATADFGDAVTVGQPAQVLAGIVVVDRERSRNGGCTGSVCSAT